MSSSLALGTKDLEISHSLLALVSRQCQITSEILPRTCSNLSCKTDAKALKKRWRRMPKLNAVTLCIKLHTEYILKNVGVEKSEMGIQMGEAPTTSDMLIMPL